MAEREGGGGGAVVMKTFSSGLLLQLGPSTRNVLQVFGLLLNVRVFLVTASILLKPEYLLLIKLLSGKNITEQSLTLMLLVANFANTK